MKAQARTFFAARSAHSASHSVSRSCFLLPSHRPVRRSNPISISKRRGKVSFAILRCVARTGALILAVTLTALLAAAHAALPDIPTVEGPITGPGEMQPGIRPGPVGTDLEEIGRASCRERV